jgi:WhiB family redox-sensing transcriptional regulator
MTGAADFGEETTVDNPADAFRGPFSEGSAAVDGDETRSGRADGTGVSGDLPDLLRGGVDDYTPSAFSDLTEDFDLLFDAVEQDWQEQALCAQTDPEAFFPEKGGSTREAKRICRACGVRDECLEYALEHDERFGIWGGLSERERRRLKKRLG